MSTDFFQQQDVARRRTGWLVFFFLLAVTSIIAVIYLVIAMVVAAAQSKGEQPGGIAQLWNPGLFLGVSLGTLAVILLGSLYRLSQLSSGGEAVALMLGGRPIDPQTTDLAERRVLNVVEEMSLAAGVPMPPVFVLDRESSINAFAAGHQPGDAVIGVSRGCLEYLTRDELQGVMAHEFSHILNGDMRLDLRLTGVIFGILMLAMLGYYLLRILRYMPRSSGKKNGGGGAVLAILGLGVLLLVVGYVGVFFGKLIKAAVSRQREYLADSAAVQFTRYPDGIAGALKKIGGLANRSRIRDAHAEEVAHMFFSDVFEGMFLNFFATHPPLDKRIKRLDPRFDGRFPAVAPLRELAVPVAEIAPMRAEPEEAAQIREFLASPVNERRRRRASLSPAQAVGRVGTSGAAQLAYASALMSTLPADLTAAAHEPYNARVLIFALLLGREESLRQAQLASLRQKIEEPLYREVEKLATLVDRLGDEARAPLVDMSYPALRSMSPGQYKAFRDSVEALIQADERIDLFEYMIRCLLLRNLDVYFGQATPTVPRYVALRPLIEPLAQVLSTLAYAGDSGGEAAQHAFGQACGTLGRSLNMVPKPECTLAALDRALKTLAQAAPKLQRPILAACVACVAADGKVTVKESELLRAISGMLGCPVPPIPLPAPSEP